MGMEVQPGGLTGCPEVQQTENPVFPGVVETREGLEHQELGYPDNPTQMKPTASGTARPRGRQRAAVGLRSLAGGQRGDGGSRRFSLGVRGASITPPSGHAPFAPRGRLGEGSLGLRGTSGEEKSEWEGAGLGVGRSSGASPPGRPALRLAGPPSASAVPPRQRSGRRGPPGAAAGAWAADLTVRAPRAAVCKCPHGPAPRACGPHVQ